MIYPKFPMTHIYSILPMAFPPKFASKPLEQGLITIDATCPLVTKVHTEAIRFAREGYIIVLIGHAGHDEVVGTMGEAPDSIVLVQTPDDVDRLDLPDTAKIAYLTQTTLSVDDAAIDHWPTQAAIPAYRRSLPEKTSATPPNIGRKRCGCSLKRRILSWWWGAATVPIASVWPKWPDRRACPPSDRRPDDIDLTWFTGNETVAVTAGASAPEAVVQRCVALLKERFNATVESLDTKEEKIRFALPEPLKRNKKR